MWLLAVNTNLMELMEFHQSWNQNFQTVVSLEVLQQRRGVGGRYLGDNASESGHKKICLDAASRIACSMCPTAGRYCQRAVI